jgi:hypothetical protein
MRLLLLSGLAAAIVLAPTAGAEPSQVESVGGVVQVNGIPCVAHLGTCLSFLQNNPPNATPGASSTVGHSPTVRR